jgi:hypothetical protein
MLLNPWAIALMLLAATGVLLVGAAGATAFRVLRFWNPESDTARQIDLEGETWLAALLVEYGLVLQLFSLALLIVAADSFSRVLAGAMCAAGAFLANPHGMPLLLLKLGGLFCYGFWLVVHHLDLKSEYFPLTRAKFAGLLFLIPLLLSDAGLTLAYLVNLSPDIITSCCGVVFSPGAGGDGYSLFRPQGAKNLLLPFYGLTGLLFLATIVLLRRGARGASWGGSLVDLGYFCGQILYFALSLLVITIVISPYIYAMPSHRCPFDILQWEYQFIGYPIYLALLIACFAGSAAVGVRFFRHLPGLAEPVDHFHRRALLLSLIAQPLFLALVSWAPLLYLFGGGER